MIFSDAVRLENWLKEKYKFRKVELPEKEEERMIKGKLTTIKIVRLDAFNIEIFIGKKWRKIEVKDLNILIRKIKKELNLTIKKALLLLFIKLNNISGKEIVSVKT